VISYLKSPIVELIVGQGEQNATLSAHQDLLTQSPFFEQKCADFAAGGPRRINLAEEDVEAMGSFLEYLYKGEYFPKRIGEHLEVDATLPEVDEDGEQLLKHARVYNLADKFFMPVSCRTWSRVNNTLILYQELKSLAHSKIHRTTSTALGEIQYARYVYQTTSRTDTTIRKPIATFWATRSHVLRHEAEEEFRAMCLEYPQFGFDVLSLVLDQKEHKEGGVSSQLASVGVPTETPTSQRGRKRARQ